jgi:hypothetical protein
MVKKNITFSSTEEQEESNYRYWRSLTPKQRLEVHHSMLIRIYADEIRKNKRKKFTTIIFDTK